MSDFERGWKSFPTDLLEMHKPSKSQDFQISAAIFVRPSIYW